MQNSTINVTVHIPSPLRVYCDGASELTVAAASARDVLDALEQSHPGLYKSVCNETGAVRQHVNVFRNSSLVRTTQEFNAQLAADDVIMIFQAVSGG